MSKRVRRWIVNVVIGVLLVVGLALIFNEPIKNWIIDNMAQNHIEQLTKKKVATNTKKKTTFDFRKVKSLGVNEVAHAAVNQNGILTIGKLAIPSVGMHLPIVKGLSNDALATGGATMKANQKMGRGNYALAGHYMLNNGTNLFSPLDNIKLGAAVYITNLSRVYQYKVTVKKVVNPYATELIADVAGKKLITLITCADGGVNRLAIQGTLVTSVKATKTNLALFSK
ncbi:class A sortase [Loigolactobacillus binensis]|uniref:Class A sortase n=1 Tax=Loigolactobacillus binensis TaxID=2559922 RepID=A0ABW3EBH8_9LACO|nr:class A sortase [Loigolactobacillus binensis]